MKEFLGENGWLDFQSYLRDLAGKNGKPFNCPSLAVLPEEVKRSVIASPGYLGRKPEYREVIEKKGTLFCWEAIGTNRGYCAVHGQNIILDGKKMQIFCAWKGNLFIVRLLDFILKPLRG